MHHSSVMEHGNGADKLGLDNKKVIPGSDDHTQTGQY